MYIILNVIFIIIPGSHVNILYTVYRHVLNIIVSFMNAFDLGMPVSVSDSHASNPDILIRETI